MQQNVEIDLSIKTPYIYVFVHGKQYKTKIYPNRIIFAGNYAADIYGLYFPGLTTSNIIIQAENFGMYVLEVNEDIHLVTSHPPV